MKNSNNNRGKISVFETKNETWYDNKSFTISDLQQYLHDLQNDGWEEIVFRTEDDSYCIEVNINKSREETDEEYNKRMKVLDDVEKRKKSEKAQAKLMKDEQDRKEYERLKKKFEKALETQAHVNDLYEGDYVIYKDNDIVYFNY